MRIKLPWEEGYAEQQAELGQKTGGAPRHPVKLPTAGWSGPGYSLEHRRETVDIQQSQILDMRLGFNPDEARTLAVAAAERHDRRS